MMKPRRITVGVGIGLCGALLAASAGATPPGPDFTFEPAGQLLPGSGTGRQDETVYVPGMRFPLESAPAFLNSQVHGHGGISGPKKSGECDAPNFAYPWRDNFCETRAWPTQLCPGGEGHQGQDIRGATCAKDKHVVVAVADGKISSIGPYTVNLISGGTQFRYLHMDNVKLKIKYGQEVKRGDPLGTISNKYYKDDKAIPTTIHLHFEVRQNVTGIGLTPIPPYTSLVSAYQELLGLPTSGSVPPAPVPPDPTSPPGPATAVVAATAGTTEAPPKAMPTTTSTATPTVAKAAQGGCGCSIPGGGNGPGSFWIAFLAAAGLMRRSRAAKGSSRRCSG